MCESVNIKVRVTSISVDSGNGSPLTGALCDLS